MERKMLKLAAGGALLVGATHALALSLGAVQGQVIIGRPLDILVQSSIEPSDAAAGLCLEAEVVYGDTRVAPTAVSAAIHRVGPAGTGALRVRANQPVTEPIVTVVLKAGCQQTFRRSYALLADVEPVAPPASVPLATPVATRPTAVSGQVLAPVPRPASPTPPAAAATAPSHATRPAAASGGRPAVGSAVPLAPETPIRLQAPVSRPAGIKGLRSKARPVATLPVPAEATAAPASPLQSAVPAESGPRLKLDPVDLSPTGAPVVTPADVAATPAAENGAGPVASTDGAPAATADAPQAPAAELAMAQELEALRAEQERLRVAMETINAQLTQAESDRYLNPVVLGLGAAVLALLGGLLVLLRRRRPAPVVAPAPTAPWWESKLPEDAAAQAHEPTPAAGNETLLPAWASADEVDGLEVREAGESMFREVPITPLNSNELLDVWQRVDFFESIGQHTEAMAALQAYVTNHARSSEAPYLRWLAIARAAGSAEAQALAQAFYEHHFQRLVPARSDEPLEADAAWLQALADHWPTDVARQQLEAALASQPGAPGAALRVRSVNAYDDVLLLLGTLNDRDGLPDAVAAMPNEPLLAPVAPLQSVPVAVGKVTQTDTPAEPEPLAFVAPDFPPLSLTDTPPAPAPAAKPTEHEPLDFDFFDWEAAPKKPDADHPGTPPAADKN